MHRTRFLSCVLAVAGASLPAQDIVLENLADFSRKTWVDVALPAVDAASLPLLCRFDPQGWIAYRGRAIGQHSVMFHVLADFAGSERVAGSLVPVSNVAATMTPWGMSDWVADDTFAVLPLPVVLTPDLVEYRLVNPVFEQVEAISPARQVFHMRGRLGSSPFVYDAYIYTYSAQDTVEIECTLTCSDPDLGVQMSTDVAAIWLEAGEYLHLDYRTRLGLPEPQYQDFEPNHRSYHRWVQGLTGPRSFGRGEGMFVAGATLCYLEPGRPAAPQSYATNGMAMHWSVGDRIRGLQGRCCGPAVGMWQDWDDKWLAFGMVPEVPIPHRHDGGVTDSDASWALFENLLQTPADLFVRRPRGQLKYAGSSGSQEDFGACKGALAVTVGDPRWIFDAGYSIAEPMMRAFHFRERDGRPMRAANHPALRCFSQKVHCPTTGDTLGYPCPPIWGHPSTGWTTWDDQHRSQNNMNAMLALTGRFALVDQLRDLAEVDKAMVPNWMDSPRAEGRLQMAWANMLLLMENPAERQALLQNMLQRIQAVMNRWPGGQFVGNPHKPIRAMWVGSSPGFLEPGTTDRVPAIIVWEHSIAVMGFYAAWRVTGDQRFHDMAKEVSTLIVQHCCFLENGNWVVPTGIRYLQGDREGDRLPQSSYYTGSPDIHVTPFLQWILPSILICRELHRGNNPARVARCDAILQNVAPHGPADWQTAEWWAVFPR